MQQRYLWGQDEKEKKKKYFSFPFWTYVHYQNDIVRTKNYEYATQNALEEAHESSIKS